MILWIYFIINLLIGINNMFFFIPYLEKYKMDYYNKIDKLVIFLISLLFGIPMEVYCLMAAIKGEENE